MPSCLPMVLLRGFGIATLVVYIVCVSSGYVCMPFLRGWRGCMCKIVVVAIHNSLCVENVIAKKCELVMEARRQLRRCVVAGWRDWYVYIHVCACRQGATRCCCYERQEYYSPMADNCSVASSTIIVVVEVVVVVVVGTVKKKPWSC
jgi:hypothetical protein